MEDSIQENTKFLQNEGKKERFIVKSSISRERFLLKIVIFQIFFNSENRTLENLREKVL